MVELVIESLEPNNILEPEYQNPAYIIYISIDEDTVNRFLFPYDFENMEIREVIEILIEYLKNSVNDVKRRDTYRRKIMEV